MSCIREGVAKCAHVVAEAQQTWRLMARLLNSKIITRCLESKVMGIYIRCTRKARADAAFWGLSRASSCCGSFTSLRRPVRFLWWGEIKVVGKRQLCHWADLGPTGDSLQDEDGDKPGEHHAELCPSTPHSTKNCQKADLLLSAEPCWEAFKTDYNSLHIYVLWLCTSHIYIYTLFNFHLYILIYLSNNWTI